MADDLHILDQRIVHEAAVVPQPERPVLPGVLGERQIVLGVLDGESRAIRNPTSTWKGKRILKAQTPLVGDRGFEAGRPGVLGFLEQSVQHGQVIIQGLHLHPLIPGEQVRIVKGRLELRGVKSGGQHRDVEDEDAKGIVGLEPEPGPVGIVEHQLDVRPLGDDVVDPAHILVVLENPIIEGAGLLVRDPVEIDTVEVLERESLVAIEARRPGRAEIVPGLAPPGIEAHAGRPRCQRVDPGVVAVAPDAPEIHPLAALGLDPAQQTVLEGRQMVVRVDGGDGVKLGLDPPVCRGVALP